MIAYVQILLALNMWCKENAIDYSRCVQVAQVCAKVVRDYDKCVERLKEQQ